MSKHADMVAHIAETFELPKPTAAKMIAEVFAHIGGQLTKEDAVVGIPGFGRFVTKIRKASTGRNPRTGETMAIPERLAVAFRPALALRNSVAPPAPKPKQGTAKAKAPNKRNQSVANANASMR